MQDADEVAVRDHLRWRAQVVADVAVIGPYPLPDLPTNLLSVSVVKPVCQVRCPAAAPSDQQATWITSFPKWLALPSFS